MPPDMIMQVLRITEQQKSMAMEQVPQRSLLLASCQAVLLSSPDHILASASWPYCLAPCIFPTAHAAQVKP